MSVCVFACTQPPSADKAQTSVADREGEVTISSFNRDTVAQRIQQLYTATCEGCTFSVTDTTLCTQINWPTKNVQEAGDYLPDMATLCGDHGFGQKIPLGMRFRYRVFAGKDSTHFLEFSYDYQQLKRMMDSIAPSYRQSVQACMRRIMESAPNYAKNYGLRYGAVNELTLTVRPEWEKNPRMHLKTFTALFELLKIYPFKGQADDIGIQTRILDSKGSNLRI
jgi:hypothetical protein